MERIAYLAMGLLGLFMLAGVIAIVSARIEIRDMDRLAESLA